MNGPFGVGKIATAEALIERLPGSMLFDPEVIGAALRPLLAGIDPADDFQDRRSFRGLAAAASGRLRRDYGHAPFMPLAVLRREYVAARVPT